MHKIIRNNLDSMSGFLEAQVKSILTKQWLKLWPEEIKVLKEKEHIDLKAELITHQIFIMNLTLKMEGQVYLPMVFKEFSYFDSKHQTNFMSQYRKLITTRYYIFIILESFDKRIEYSATQLNKKITSITTWRISEILRQSLADFKLEENLSI